MEETQLIAKLGFLKSLREGILHALEKFSNEKQFISIAKRLCEEYNREYSDVNELLGFRLSFGLQYIHYPSDGAPNDWYSTLCVLLPQVDKGIEGLQSKISPLSGRETLELKTLKEEMQKLFVNWLEAKIYVKNVKEAIKEAEEGYFLGSALVSSRVISYVFDQISGKTIQEKIETLKNKGLVEEKGEVPPEYIMKADKKARNYFSHDINAFPDGSETIELLIICKRLLELLKSYLQKNIE